MSSFIIYNILKKKIKHCIINNGKDSYNTILMYFKLCKTNGDFIFEIEEDFRDIPDEQIKKKCVEMLINYIKDV